MRVVILHNELAPFAAVEERDVLIQRDCVHEALRELGHEVDTLGCTLDFLHTRDQLLSLRPDVVFNLVESLGGTDRFAPLATLLLDGLEIPYTGSRTRAMLAAADKLAAKRLLRQVGLPTPDWVDNGSSRNVGENRDSGFGPRLIVKPVWEHASLGMSDDAVFEARTADAAMAMIEARESFSGRPHYAEAFVAGREFNLSLLAASVLPPAEIDFSTFPDGKPRIVGHAAKWDDKSFEFHGTPRIFEFSGEDQELLNDLSRLAQECWRVFGLSGYARVDFRVDEAGRPWILEVNTNPCLSPDAGFAAAISQAGMTFADAVDAILGDALVGLPLQRSGA